MSTLSSSAVQDENQVWVVVFLPTPEVMKRPDMTAGGFIDPNSIGVFRTKPLAQRFINQQIKARNNMNAVSNASPSPPAMVWTLTQETLIEK
jgi:hypothetical protein